MLLHCCKELAVSPTCKHHLSTLAALAEVAADAPLMDSGLDSLGAVEFRSSLESRLSLQLPPTLVFDYPSLSAIVGYLDNTLAAQQGASEAAPAQDLAVPSSGLAPCARPLLQLAAADQAAAQVIAVLATHGRFPEPRTAARNAGRGLAGQVSLRDCISVVPVERYDVEMRLTDDMPARFGGFIAGAQVSHDLAAHHAQLVLSLRCSACFVH